MLKLKKEILLEEDTVAKVQFEGEHYFSVEDVAAFIKEDLSGVETVELLFNGKPRKAATIETIEKRSKLSEFNQALMKMKNIKG